MHAFDRFLPEWFNRVRSRQITLPRFQRHLAWSHTEVAGLLTTVLRGLPSGAALVLNVGDEEKFKSRTMIDAPENGEKVAEQLLDGQQRLTALWRSLHDKYPERKYFVGFEPDPNDPAQQIPYAYGQARWLKKGNRYPLWVNDPQECWERRGVLPISLLLPEDLEETIDSWVEEAIQNSPRDKFAAYKALKRIISSLRTQVREFNLPYLSLPASTPKEVALDVFVKMNTSAVRLSTYDIVVALVEDETDKSLHEHVQALAGAVPRAAAYADLPSLVLDVVALRQDRMPSQAGYRGIDYTRMIDEWDMVVEGVRGMVRFLEEETIFDQNRLPSYTALPVLAALWEHLPDQPDQLGNARYALRRYLWRAFLTARYEQSSTSNSLQDYRALRTVLTQGRDEAEVPIFSSDSYPLPTEEMVRLADWPRKKTIFGRGILALQLRCGAEDLADGAKATVASITSPTHPREYHHLFPASLLAEAEVPEREISRALNCALITFKTNRTISNKDPISYLKDRADNNSLGHEELVRRLQTHLIPYDALAVGYDGLSGEAKNARVQLDYENFLQARAQVVAAAAQCVCQGRNIDLAEVFDGVAAEI